MLLIRDRRWALGVFASVVGVAGVALVVAGPLNPPAGVVTSTYKTLTEVEPRIAINSTNTPGDTDSVYKITQPGSYYLPGNLTGVSGKMGIEIASGNVSIDLNGFTLLGAASSLAGIKCTVTGATALVIRNGIVRDWAQEGIELNSSGVVGAEVASIHAIANYTGIWVGASASVRDCSVVGNLHYGIVGSSNCIVSACTANGNGTGEFAGGIIVGTNSSVLDCTAFNNGIGSDGGYGIGAADHSMVARCTANYNGTTGINSLGITVGYGSLVDHCVANYNGSTAATGEAGIYAQTGSTVQYCDASFNANDGIVASDQCTILNNTCSTNGRATGIGANIHIRGVKGRIEANHCYGADRGIDIDFAGNIVIRNTCSSNTTNWDIVAGNDVAPIFSATTNSSAIVGNTYSGNLGTADPNANFTH